MTTTIFASLALAAAAVTGLASPALAGDLPVAVVRYGDINLANAAGAQTLQTRVKRAAARVCQTSERDLAAVMAAKQCQRLAVARAMPQVELALAQAGTQVAQNSASIASAH
jgi:UrcA family protein